MADPETSGARREGEGSSAEQRTLVHTETFVLEQRQHESSFFHVADVMVRRWRLVILLPLVAAAVLMCWDLLAHPRYTATAEFAGQSTPVQLSGLANLASSFGLSIPAASFSSSESPQFYADLVGTEAFLRQVVAIRYVVPLAVDTLRGDLSYFFHTHGNQQPVRLESATEALRKHLSVGANDQTGVVSVSVTTRWPVLSRAIASQILDLVNRFNLESRQSEAAAERRFIGGRLGVARSALRGAEDSLKSFLEANRRYANSPALTFEHDRLQRRVNLREQLYASLSISYERAKIEEVRNTPVITVVEAPLLPARPDSRHIVVGILLACVAGVLAAVLWALAVDLIARGRARHPSEYAAFVVGRETAVGEVRALFARLAGSLGRPGMTGRR